MLPKIALYAYIMYSATECPSGESFLGIYFMKNCSWMMHSLNIPGKWDLIKSDNSSGSCWNTWAQAFKNCI